MRKRASAFVFFRFYLILNSPEFSVIKYCRNNYVNLMQYYFNESETSKTGRVDFAEQLSVYSKQLRDKVQPPHKIRFLLLC